MNRRRFIGAGLTSLLLPRPLKALPNDSDQLFLFLFVRGGWDPTFVFTNQISSPNVYTQEGCEPVQIGELNYISHPLRPNVDGFFEEYGNQTCIINGIEVESLTHEACQRIIFTGQPSAGRDDWPAIIGSYSAQPLPVMVVSGPSYTADFTRYVIRSGEDGQLSKLLTGEVHQYSDVPITSLPVTTQNKVQQFLEERITEKIINGTQEQISLYEQLQETYQQRSSSAALSQLQLGSATGFTSVPTQVEAAIHTLTSGVSQCLVVEHNGLYEAGWDQHSNIDTQNYHYDLLFSDLKEILDNLDMWGGAGFSQRVNIIVFSEMGRAPTLNALAGKDHWTFTSAMCISQNIEGGRVIGGYNDQLIGKSIDYSTAELYAGGNRITSQNFGASILQMAGIDSQQFLPGIKPIIL
jgi:hypothetical protein